MSTKKNVLLVLTSHGDLGGVRPTGYYVSEAAEPWDLLTKAGHHVQVASIAGGEPPRDGYDPHDPVQQRFLAAVDTAHTPAVAELDPQDYDAILFAGGHGTMWDFPRQPALARAVNTINDKDGVVAAVCHGPAAFIGLPAADGSPLIAGRRLTGFSNEEESAVHLTDAVPFSLQDQLTGAGAEYSAGAPFSEHVVTDGRWVTGQNPQSATAVGKAMVELLDS